MTYYVFRKSYCLEMISKLLIGKNMKVCQYSVFFQRSENVSKSFQSQSLHSARHLKVVMKAICFENNLRDGRVKSFAMLVEDRVFMFDIDSQVWGRGLFLSKQCMQVVHVDLQVWGCNPFIYLMISCLINIYVWVVEDYVEREGYCKKWSFFIVDFINMNIPACFCRVFDDLLHNDDIGHEGKGVLKDINIGKLKVSLLGLVKIKFKMSSLNSEYDSEDIIRAIDESYNLLFKKLSNLNSIPKSEIKDKSKECTLQIIKALDTANSLFSVNDNVERGRTLREGVTGELAPGREIVQESGNIGACPHVFSGTRGGRQVPLDGLKINLSNNMKVVIRKSKINQIKAQRPTATIMVLCKNLCNSYLHH